MRKLGLFVLAGLLVFPVGLTVDPGARSAIAVGSAVTDVAMAQSNAAFANSNNDPGSDVPPNANPNAAVWQMWKIDGSLQQDGAIDPTECGALGNLDDCKTNAVAVAISNNGDRIAAASFVDDNVGSILVFANRLQGVLSNSRFELANQEVTDIGLNDDGTKAIVGGRDNRAQATNKGVLAGYSVGSPSSQLFTYNPASAVIDVDINGAGTRLAGAGGGFHCGTVVSGHTAETGSMVGSVQRVAISEVADAWSVAGDGGGYFALFSERGSSSSCGREYQKRDVTSAIHAVAIRDDATAFAVGNAAGTVWLYKLDPSTPDLVSLLTRKDNLGDVRDLQFSGNGRYLAAITGNSLRLLDTSSGLAEVFRDDRSGLIASVGIDERGEHLVAGAGSNVIVYDAIHRLVGSAPPNLVQDAGTTVDHTLSYRNDGNRAEQVQLAFGALPSGVFAQLTPAQFTVQPGLTQSVELTLTLDAAKSPGDLVVPIIHSLQSGVDGTGTTQVRVNVPTRHDLQLKIDGAASQGIQPAGTATFVVNATNGGNVAETVIWTFSGAPQGWTVEANPAAMTVAAGTTLPADVIVRAPSTAPQLAQARITATASGGPNVLLTATVGAQFGVSLQAPPGRIIEEGVATSMELTGTNTGNAPDTLRFKLGALPSGWQGAFVNGFGEFQANDVGAGQSRTATLTLRAPEGSVSNVPVQVSVVLQSLGDTSKFQSRAILVTVEPAAITETETTDDGGGGGGNGIPGPGPIFLLGALGLAFALRRRT